MALWIIFALAAAMLWALDNILDKHLLTHELKDAYSYDILTNLNDILPIIVIPLFFQIRYDPVFSYIALIFGVLTVIALLYYNKAMMKEEASRIASLEWTSPVFVAILSFILFGETLPLWGYVGVLLIICGAFIISHKRRQKIVISKAVLLILVFAFLFAVGDVVTDFTLGYMDFWSFFFWASIGSVASSIFFLGFPKIRNGFLAEMKIMKMRVFLMILAVSIIYYFAEIFFYAALSLGQVTLVAGLVASQPIFTLIYASWFSFYKPKFLKEQVDSFNIMTKFLGIALIVSGVVITAAFGAQ